MLCYDLFYSFSTPIWGLFHHPRNTSTTDEFDHYTWQRNVDLGSSIQRKFFLEQHKDLSFDSRNNALFLNAESQYQPNSCIEKIQLCQQKRILTKLTHQIEIYFHNIVDFHSEQKTNLNFCPNKQSTHRQRMNVNRILIVCVYIPPTKRYQRFHIMTTVHIKWKNFFWH